MENGFEDYPELDWDTLNGRTLECKVIESEGIKLVMLYDHETRNSYVIDVIMPPTVHQNQTETLYRMDSVVE